MLPPPMKLRDLLELAARRQAPPGWLFLPKDWRTWGEETPGFMVHDAADSQADFDDVAAEAERHGFASTIDAATLEDVVQAAKDLGPDSPALRVEALVYYVRF